MQNEKMQKPQSRGQRHSATPRLCIAFASPLAPPLKLQQHADGKASVHFLRAPVVIFVSGGQLLLVLSQ